MGLVAFTKTLAREGAKYGIAVNVIAPMAASAMTETVRLLPFSHLVVALKPALTEPHLFNP